MSVQDTAAPVDREQLRARLSEIAPPLADIYAGAISVLSRPEFPGRAHFLAHAAREIANGLPEWTTGVTGSPREAERLERLAERWRAAFPAADIQAARLGEAATSVVIPRDIFDEMSKILIDRSTRSSSRDSVLRFFNWLGPGNRYLPADLTRFVREWMRLRGWFEGNAHARRSPKKAPPDEGEAVAYFERFEQWLDSLLKGFFASQRELDARLEETTPDRLPELMPLLVPDQQRRHFFDKLAQTADPDWLEALRTAGFFENPPAQALRDPDRQTETHVVWPAASYLVRMAQIHSAQATVAAIVQQILNDHEIENHLLQRDLVDVALALPPSLSAKLSRGMRTWGQEFSDQLAQRLGTLSVNLASSSETDDALSLMRGLLSSNRPSAAADDTWPLHAEPRMGRWGLATLVEKVLPTFLEVTRLAGLSLVCEALDAVLRSERRDDREGDDHSHVWRPIVEDANVEQGPARELLACAVFRSASTLAQDSAALGDVVAVLDRQEWRFFRRVSQVLLLRFPDSAPERLQGQLLHKEEWESFDREYRMLLEFGFPRLGREAQAQILSWVDAGPERDRVRENLAFWTGKEPTADDVEERVRMWRWHRLGPLTAHLPAVWRARQAELNAEFGSPPTPDAPDFRTSSGTIPRATALTPEELHSLSVEEITSRLRAYQPGPHQGPLVPDDGSNVLDAVARTPGRFASEALRFRGLKPAYVRAFLAGLERSQRDRTPFDWAPALELASWMVAQRPVERPHDDPWHEEAGWEWARAALARLFQTGLERPETAPVPAYREQIWGLIETLGDDPPQNRAEAAAAAIVYAAWVAQGKTELFEAAPEAGGFLERQLDRLDSSQVHSRVGEMLTYLAWHAAHWTSGNLHRLLPEQQEIWAAAWQAHVRGQVPPRRAFAVLMEGYRRAVEQLAPAEPDRLPGVRAEGRLQQESLAEHLVILYGRGDLEATGQGAVLDLFFKRADPSLRRHAHWAAAHSIRHRDEDGSEGPEFEVPPEVLDRFQALWESRVRQLPNDPSIREELPAFGSWFAAARFDDDWALGQLESVLEQGRVGSTEPLQYEPGVMRRLAQLATAHPVRIARILRRIVDLTQEGMGAYGWLDEAREIIQVAVRSGDPNARTAVIGVLDRLGALGFRDVRELVGSTQDLDDPLAIPYFLWDQPLTVAQFRQRLSGNSESERDRLLGLLLREARDVDVWKFTTPQDVLARWNRIERHVGKRRAFWELLLRKWQEEGLLAR